MKKIMLFFSILVFSSACSGPTFKERIVDDNSGRSGFFPCLVVWLPPSAID